MRRFLSLLLIFCLGAVPVRAAGFRYVALTFDDGPSGRYTRDLLEGLSQRNARATFFLCGYRMAEYPELTRQIFREGHEIGYHGYSHRTMKGMSRRAVAEELIASGELLPEECTPVLLRPPGGCCSDGVRQVAQARQLAIVNWSLDPRDWATDSVGAIESAVLKTVKDGDIILLHDMSASSVRAALDIIDVLQQQGYRFVTVSELARLRGCSIRPGEVYTCFPPKEREQVK